MAVDLILGTAGHVDHGKTSLIRALTGIDTDRLPEEKRRGITIDLGFALLELPPFQLGIVDCPGHERFIRNMLAGATGMDLALLVVAADDSVNRQTREHLDILRQLNLRGGVIALTKSDLVTEQRLADVEQAVRGLVRDSPLAEAAVVPTSVVTGKGLVDLRAALHTAAEQVALQIPPADREPFRMAIDRAFVVAGHGTIVTGTISSGRVKSGDVLVIEPGGIEVRARALQNHERPVTELLRGQRGAINLVGVHHDEIARGQELGTPGFLVPARTLTARLRLLPDAPTLKSRSRVRLHIGTAEILAGVRLLGWDRLSAGESALVQFDLSEAAVATWNQPFVIRRESPLQTLGGGRILDPAAHRIRSLDNDGRRELERLESAEEVARAGAALYLAGLRGWQPADLPRLAGVFERDSVCAALLASGELVELPASRNSVPRLHQRVIEQLSHRVAVVLASLHKRQPLRLSFASAELFGQFPGLPMPVLDAAIAYLVRQGRVEESEQGLALAGQGPRLSRAERQCFEKLVEWFHAAGVSSPGLAACTVQAGANKRAVPQLLDLAVASGHLVVIAPDYWLHPAVEEQARKTVAAAFTDQRSLTVSQIRELLGTTRKYAVPLCEYWDKMGFTQRRGDLRILRERLA